MQVQQALFQRRTVHNYSPEPIPDQIVEEALRSILYGQNHRHTHPWRLYTLGEKHRKAVAAIACEILEESKPEEPITEVKRSAVHKKLLNPGLFVVIARKTSDDPFQAREDYAAIACGVQNFCLAMTAHGYGSKWGTGKPTRDPRVYQLLGIDKDQEVIEGFLYAGKPEGPLKSVEKPKLGEALRPLD